MNIKTLRHTLIALAIQAGTAGLLHLFGINYQGGLLVGAAAGMWFFIGREHAQAEYRAIEWFYGHKRENLPWWGGFDPSAWTDKAILDMVLPAAAVAAVYFAARVVL